MVLQTSKFKNVKITSLEANFQIYYYWRSQCVRKGKNEQKRTDRETISKHKIF